MTTKESPLYYLSRADARRVEKPWGYELIFAHTDHYVGKVLHIAAGLRLSRQYHVTKEETLMVGSGVMRVELGTDTNLTEVEMGTGDVCHLPPGTVHRLMAVTDVDVIEVSTTQLEDVVRLEDDFGRTGSSLSQPAEVRPAHDA